TRAIAFPRPRRAELHHDVRLPEMDDDGVLVRTEYSTISRGTELDLYTGQMHGRGVDSQWYPMLPGYMPVGLVEAVGPRVRHVAVGDRVVGSNLLAGFDERYCPAWAGHTQQVVFSSSSHPRLGGLRAVRVPPGVRPEQAGLGMLAGVAWHGVRDKVKPAAGDIVLVIGQGVVGNFAGQLCRSLGARVIVTDKHPERLAIARANGVQDTVAADGRSLKEAVLQITDGQAPHAVIETTGELEPVRLALDIVRDHGRVQVQGMYMDPAPPDLLRTLLSKSLSLTATLAESPELTSEALDMMAAGKISTEGMISELADPHDAGMVYDALYRQPDRYLTCAFKWQ
ncbi:MAG: medium chain dehydrogenase/reductase family protein, partial [Anaerolineales bacterium]